MKFSLPGHENYKTPGDKIATYLQKIYFFRFMGFGLSLLYG